MSVHCLHCGASFPEATPSEFCCQGCASAYQWVHEAGLGAYYSWRTAAPEALNRQSTPVQASKLAHFDRPELLREHARTDDAGVVHITLSIGGIRCAACAWLIEHALQRIPGVQRCEINALTGYLNLSFQPAQVLLSQLLHTLTQLGYSAYLSNDAVTQVQAQAEKRRWQLRLGVALIAAFQAMMFAEPLYLDVQQSMSIPMRDFMRWLSFLLSTPVVFFSGWPFLAGAWYELKARAPSMDCLISLSVLLAYFASVWECVRGGPHVYFDAAVMFVLFLLIARGLEARARIHARAGLHQLTRTLPAFVERLSGTTAETIPVNTVQVGDQLRIAAGDVLPVDGELCSGDDNSAVRIDESALTGECTPVMRAAGSQLYAGSIALESLSLRATAPSDAGWLMQLGALAQRQQNSQTELGWGARSLRKMAQHFALWMVGLALAVFMVWYSLAPERAFEIALAVLACSCPCAFALAIPAARQAAHAALVDLGLLALRPIDLKRLAALRIAVFDKTGTLTENRLEILPPQHHGAGSDVDWAEVNQLVCALEAPSKHPLARAMVHYAQSQLGGGQRAPITLTNWQEHAGAGVQANVIYAGAEHHYRLGRKQFALGLADDGALWLVQDGKAIASWQWCEVVRAEAVEALAALRGLGLSTQILSGDHPDRVGALAQRFQPISDFAGMNPQQKLAHVQQLKTRAPVLMVGDGLNDAPVLAAADVAVAMSSAAALALKQADFVLVQNKLSVLAPAIRLALQAQRVERQNLIWAVGYNAAMLPFAALGWVQPWQAALGMALSSLLVTANALRLRFYLRRESANKVETSAPAAVSVLAQ